MRTIVFGADGRRVSPVILGTMRIAKKERKEAEALLSGALESGIDFIDLADVYGGGRSEELVGEVFSGSPGMRGRFFLQSKCGIRRTPTGQNWYDLSGAYIEASVDGILRRLRTDRLDCLMLHRPDALMDPEEIAGALDRLAGSGKVLSFGVSNMSPQQIEMLSAALSMPVCADQVQLSCAHTALLDEGFNFNTARGGGIMRTGGILEYCRGKGITLQAWSSLQYGMFEGTFLGSPKYPELNACLERIGEAHGVTPMTAAIAWILRIPGSMQAVVGTTDPARVKQAAAAADVTLTREEWYEIYLSAGRTLP